MNRLGNFIYWRDVEDDELRIKMARLPIQGEPEGYPITRNSVICLASQRQAKSKEY